MVGREPGWKHGLELAAGRLDVVQADLDDVEAVVAILEEAARWLIKKGVPTWIPGTLEPVMRPAIERGEVYLAKLNNQPVATVTLQWEDEF